MCTIHGMSTYIIPKLNLFCQNCYCPNFQTDWFNQNWALRNLDHLSYSFLYNRLTLFPGFARSHCTQVINQCTQNELHLTEPDKLAWPRQKTYFNTVWSFIHVEAFRFFVTYVKLVDSHKILFHQGFLFVRDW